MIKNLEPCKYFNVISTLFRLICHRDVAQRQIKVKETLYASTLEFTTLSNAESTLLISTSNQQRLKMSILRFHFQRRINVVNKAFLKKAKHRLWIKIKTIYWENHLNWRCWAQNILHFIPHFQRNVKNYTWKPAKILKTTLK